MKHESDILKRIKSYFMRRKSAEEAYDFEREIERDPFLYEAMEGFEDMLTSDIQQSLDELDDRLDQRSNRLDLAFLLNWRAAAAVAVLVVGALVFALIGRQGEEVETATIDEEAQQYLPRQGEGRFSEMNEDADYAYEESAEEEGLDDAQSIKAEPDLAPETISKKEPVVEVAAAEPKGSTLDTEAKASPKPAEVVVLEQAKALTAQPMSRAKALESSDVAAGSQEETEVKKETTQASAPVGGMAAYNAYLKRNLQRSDNMPRGNVVLTFEFDKDGSPRKIEVAKSLCTACDAEARRLIEAGPKWIAEDKKERVSISVEF